MAVYMIGYDLITPGKDYNTLVQAITQVFPTHWHCLDSTWLIVSDLSSQQIRDYLLTFIDSNDRLLVAQMGRSAAWTNSFNTGCQNWLRTNL